MPGPEDQYPAALDLARPAYGAQRVAAGFDERARRVVDAVRKAPQCPYRHEQLFRERAVPATANADLVAVGAHVLTSVEAAVAGAAADHRVSGHPSAQPLGGYVGTDSCDHTGPLVAEPQGVAGLAGVQVAHLAGEELHVGATDPDPVDVDHHLAGAGHRWIDVGHGGLVGSGQDEGAHEVRERR